MSALTASSGEANTCAGCADARLVNKRAAINAHAHHFVVLIWTPFGTLVIAGARRHVTRRRAMRCCCGCAVPGSWTHVASCHSNSLRTRPSLLVEYSVERGSR